MKGHDQHGDGVSRQSYAFEFPGGGAVAVDAKEVVGEDDGVARGEAEDHGEEGEARGEEPFWSGVGLAGGWLVFVDWEEV